MKRNAALCFLNSVSTANVYQICSAPTEYETALTVQEEEEHLRLHLCDPVCGGVERKVNLFFFFSSCSPYSCLLSFLFSAMAFTNNVFVRVLWRCQGKNVSHSVAFY